MAGDNVPPSLAGRHIALTIANGAEYSPAGALLERKAALIYYPVVQSLPPDSYDELDRVLQAWHDGEYDWLVLTTPCAVEAVTQRITHLEISLASRPKIKIASYGALTRLVLAEQFASLPNEFPFVNAHLALVDAMQLDQQSAVALPLAQHSRADWRKLLAATGAKVGAPPAYRLTLGRDGDDLPGALWGGIVDALIFLTENSVRQFAIRLKYEGGSLDMLKHVVVACLDAQTAAAAEAYDLDVKVLPAEPTFTTLVEGLAHHFASETSLRR